MLQRALGVTLIVVLGGTWFVLQEYGAPDGGNDAPPERIAAASQGAESEARAPDGAGRLAEARRDSASQAPRLGAEAPRGTSKPPRSAPPPAAEVRAAGDDPFAGAMASAARLHAAGDTRGAEAVLRQAMARATSAGEMAQAALQLAALTQNRTERRQLLSVALQEDAVRGADFDVVGRMLRELNATPNNSLIPLLTVERHTVTAGENLWTLVNKVFPKKYGVSLEVGLVKLVNGMRSDTLKVGQVLLVPIGELALRVDTREHALVAWLGDVAVAAYRVGLGKDDRTPRGNFVIKVKQEDPAWFFDGKVIPHGDPENILGTRWMGFEDQPGAMGFGIHGTTKPETIGFSESMGCVRMRNGEVEELFQYVARGTRVVIS